MKVAENELFMSTLIGNVVIVQPLSAYSIFAYVDVTKLDVADNIDI